ncbi:sperm flagellar protein 2-like isoform X2 [Trachemys scripta elegans]|uniref:sperm flagellar protein 2-like isoform X2 n=1 Tax=Trachemys scripta elegans TaxID=31138 RepID=UPI001551CCE4|nr:sperm flagellar protein 2-like isoform X2 [Trachemys scripta elegans]
MRLTVSDLQNLATTLMVNAELIDWRRFLLTAAQPWPVPSVIQLLNTLHSFKAVDEAGSGFVTQEYYNQFFFILFADARKDPSQLDYTKMLLYFASHPDAVEGVYRALSIATGTYIRRRKEVSPPHVSLSHTDMLIKEEPLVEKGEILPCTDEGRISMATLQRVFHHEGSKAGDNHRFSSPQKAGSNNKHFRKIYEELGSEDLKPIPVTILLKHPFIQDLINSYQGYKLPVRKDNLLGNSGSGFVYLGWCSIWHSIQQRAGVGNVWHAACQGKHPGGPGQFYLPADVAGSADRGHHWPSRANRGGEKPRPAHRSPAPLTLASRVPNVADLWHRATWTRCITYSLLVPNKILVKLSSLSPLQKLPNLLLHPI